MGLIKQIGKWVVLASAGGFLGLVCLLIVGNVLGVITGERIETVGLALKGEMVHKSELEPMGEEPKKDLDERYSREAYKEVLRAIADVSKQKENLTLQINERKALLIKLRGQVASIRTEISGKMAEMKKMKDNFEKKRAAEAAPAGQEGFKKAVATLAGMKTSEAASFVCKMDDHTAIKILKALEDDKRAKVFSEIKKLDELEDDGSGGVGKAQKYMQLILAGDTAVPDAGEGNE